MGVGSNPTSDNNLFLAFASSDSLMHNIIFQLNPVEDSRVAQWKRAGPITQRSVDRNYALLNFFLSGEFLQPQIFNCQDGRVV